MKKTLFLTTAIAVIMTASVAMAQTEVEAPAQGENAVQQNSGASHGNGPVPTPTAESSEAQAATEAEASAEAGESTAAEHAAPAAAGEASSSSHHIELPKQEWHHQGVFGTYDRAALQRGYQVYKEVCAACHSMKYLAYRNLEALGYSPEQVKTVAAEYTVMDGPNDDGEMFERPARPSDAFKKPFANDKAARAANNGALPPDLSLVIKARKGGEDYVYNLLTGYTTPPAGVELNPGMNYNKYFAGHQIAMAPPLMDGQVTYADGTSATAAQAAHDVVQFLAWASEPHMEHRKGMGIKVMLFMFVFIGLMFAVKRRVWADVHK